MKKAYVKPVFLAEEFEGTVSVAACDYSSRQAHEIWRGDEMCTHGNPGHVIGGNGNINGNKDVEVNNYWNYATDGASPSGDRIDNSNDNTGSFLFTDGQTICDFVWNSYNSTIGLWTSKTDDQNPLDNLISNKTAREADNARVTFIIGKAFMDFFRKVGSDCAPKFTEGTPFS